MVKFTPLSNPGNMEAVLADKELLNIRAALVRKGLWTDGWKIGSYVQPAQWAEDAQGRKSVMRERAVFVLTSPHPLREGEELMTYSHTKLSDFVEASKEYRHDSINALPVQFFEKMAREHLARINDLLGLTVGEALGAGLN